MGIRFFYSVAMSSLLLASQESFADTCPRIEIAPRTIGPTAAQYANSGKFSLSPDGVVLFDYGKAYGGLGKWANPYFNSHYGLALYRDWLQTGCSDEDIKNRLIRVAEWFVSTAEWRDDMAVWPHPFRNEHFNLNPGWISGIGQARIAGVLYRAAAVTGDLRYKKTADGAMQVYDHTLIEGGVVSRNGSDSWIEEAPDHNGRSFKILNGHITSIAGIIDVYSITNDPRWSGLIKSSMLTVKRNLPRFDSGFSSIYSLDWIGGGRNIAARGDYNSLHVTQLLWMYDHFKDKEFLKWASHFNSYELNYDKYYSSNSVNSTTNGPSKAKSLMGGSAWTTNAFPTTFKIELNELEKIKGVAFDSLNLNRIPVDFDVSALRGGKVIEKISIKNNDKLYGNVLFTKPIKTEELEITFSKGLGNTALSSLMPIRNDFGMAPVSDHCNHRGNFVRAEALAPGEDFVQKRFETLKVICDGWLLIPAATGKKTLKVVAVNKPGEISVMQSYDLKYWTKAESAPEKADSYIISKKYALVRFQKTAKQIEFSFL